jgi:hypothetical protein
MEDGAFVGNHNYGFVPDTWLTVGTNGLDLA